MVQIVCEAVILLGAAAFMSLLAVCWRRDAIRVRRP